ncbi:MAG: flagellar basal body L-ring protein FlgH [Proteobacteria bacterium]|jgi:flagellar L-ring protein precursor FlgH|nr:flagellar basal body L-ring protein FlgH [Alphaproteobacteria bacterium]NCC03565.1 flagellar basal body L-ring protein FlgH [Pseudomonadota bacterium]
MLPSPFLRSTSILVALALLSGCNTLSRLDEIGGAPKLAAVQDPSPIPGRAPVHMPMPAPEVGERQPNSLWRTGSRAFFRDQRAGRVGDILTVIISIDEKAEISNETKRSRNNSEDANITNLFGVESQLTKVLPEALSPENLVATGSNLSNAGKGTVDRSEKINLRVAATITQVLPNGNLVLAGRQQINVNYDLRELLITGVIRPEDISAENTVSYDQIAEARISYGGRGQLHDVQQPRYGSQVLDVIMPF